MLRDGITVKLTPSPLCVKARGTARRPCDPCRQEHRGRHHRAPRGGREAMAMTEEETRAKILELMAAGVLPSEPAPIRRPVPPVPTGPKPHMFVGDSLLDQPCTGPGGLSLFHR